MSRTRNICLNHEHPDQAGFFEISLRCFGQKRIQAPSSSVPATSWLRFGSNESLWFSHAWCFVPTKIAPLYCRLESHQTWSFRDVLKSNPMSTLDDVIRCRIKLNVIISHNQVRDRLISQFRDFSSFSSALAINGKAQESRERWENQRGSSVNNVANT